MKGDLNPPSAASVSERARDMVTALYGDKAVFTRHDVARAIEQALTQQRGEAVAEVRKGSIDNFVFCPDPNSLPIGTKLYTTTHQPSADAVRELVKRWRACAKSAANGPMFDGASEYAVAGTYIACADELESLLSAASDHQQNAAQGGKE